MGISAQKPGSVSGQMMDASDGTALSFGTITVAGTPKGTVSDVDGFYRLDNLQPGKINLIFSYIGYLEQELEVEVISGDVTKIADIQMTIASIMGEEVVVTAQYRGQAAAINQQVTSSTIVNVVSKERIQELPDMNAAEAIGRLPGISVQRDGGEGQKVVIRGLAPKYNSITVNGERIPATDIEDRSVDLSMISPDALSGIEVYKAIRPDNDGDAIGGHVNFTIRRASSGFHGSVTGQTGYNDLRNEFGQYKGSASVENRFFNNSFGALLTGNLERANRSSQSLAASYSWKRDDADGNPILDIGNLNLTDKYEIRKRYGGGLVLDYEMKNGSILFNSLYSRSDRDGVRRRRRYRIETSYQQFDTREYESYTNLFTNSLSGDHNLGRINLFWRTSYSTTNNKTPFENTSIFRETAPFNTPLITDQGPEAIPAQAKNDFSKNYWYQAYREPDHVSNQNLTGQVDLKVPFNIGRAVSGYLKMGGKLKDESRSRDVTEYQLSTTLLEEIATGYDWALDPDGTPLIVDFIDESYSSNKYLSGAYDMGPGLDIDKTRLWTDHEDQYALQAYKDLEDYTAHEFIRAGYLMSEFNIQKYVTFLVGVRYEDTQTDYKSIHGTAIRRDDGSTDIGHLIDTVGEKHYGNLLPMFHVKIQPLPWFDIRLAATKALSRPNFSSLVPWERFTSDGRTWELGNPDLKETTSWSYDAFLSFYSKMGLITVGGFYKEIENTAYYRERRITEMTDRYFGYTTIQPVNDDGLSTVFGLEFEIQTNLRFLPSPFDGIVFYANYAKIKSETHFPLLKTIFIPVPPYQATVDSVRSGRMPGQADDVATVALGYEKGKFSARLSLDFQGKYTDFVGVSADFDKVVGSFQRLDFTSKYSINENFSVFFNWNNITNEPESKYMGNGYVLEQEFYGMTMDLGLKYVF